MWPLITVNEPGNNILPVNPEGGNRLDEHIDVFATHTLKYFHHYFLKMFLICLIILFIHGFAKLECELMEGKVFPSSVIAPIITTALA